MWKIIVFWGLLNGVFLANIQSQIISGYVVDSLSGEVLIGAHVVGKTSNIGSTTNYFGFFNTQFSEDDSVSISYMGYETKIIPVSSITTLPTTIKLNPEVKIQEVIITAHQNGQDITEMSSINLKPHEIKILPSLAGETDIMKTLQLMPGIKPMGEGQSSFMVRGGAPDQNMVILDDVPIYYINHLGGYVSVFNTNAIKDVKMYKGAFPAQYGGRLSSIIDVRTKDGNFNKKSASLGLGLISSKIMFEGPIIEDTVSFYISGRRFMYDLISRPLTYLLNDKKQWGYNFYDLNAKVNYKYNDKNRFYLSLYSGHDKTLIKRNERNDNSLMLNVGNWGNLTGSFRWNHLCGGGKLFSNLTLYYMQYAYKLNIERSYNDGSEEISNASVFKSKIGDIALNTEFEYNPLTGLTLKFGSNHIFHKYIPNNYSYSQIIQSSPGKNIIFNNSPESLAFENAWYFQNNYSISKNLSFMLGYRANLFTTGSKNYIRHEPRALINLNFPTIFSVKASFASMSQYVHLLTYHGIGIPADLWMPSTENIPPQEANIFSVGLFKSLGENHLEISIEGYYKKMNNLTAYKPGHNIFNTSETWSESVVKEGKGLARGLEFLIRRKSNVLSGWVSYTLSESTRTFADLNNGQSYPYTYDATHDLSIVCSYELKQGISISSSWSYMTGRAITFPTENFHTPLLVVENGRDSHPLLNDEFIASTYENMNNVRMHPYHRLDVSLTIKKQKKRSDRVLQLGIYNLYNRQNPMYYYVGSKEIMDSMGNSTGEHKKAIYQVSLFPIVPSISYTWLW